MGYTTDLRKRIKKHLNHGVKTTSRIIPKEIVFYCAFKDKNKALKFEKYLKSNSGFAFRNKRLI